MIVLAEALELLSPSSSTRDLRGNIVAAQLSGCSVYKIPPDFSICETGENALQYVPFQVKPTPAWWIGYIPDLARYEAIYQAATAKNIILLNNLMEHRTIQEFDLAYPLLEGLTPRTIVVSEIGECANVVNEMGLPLFVKGSIQSRKARGWKACVAESQQELEILVKHLLELENRSRGRVLVRQLAPLRHTRTHDGFPMGREFRIFLYRGGILGLGYYWQGCDPLQQLSSQEQKEVENLARQVASRLNVPLIAVDIGQIEDGSWIIIETGDPQFSGTSQIPLYELWHRIAQIEL